MKKQEAVRIILINPKKEILLFRHTNTITVTRTSEMPGEYWFTPGGRLDPGETEIDGAYRELYEETGITKDQVKLGPCIWYGSVELLLYDVLTKVDQRIYVAHTNVTEISFVNFTEEEKDCISEHKWFSIEEIENSENPIYPISLAEHLKPVLEGIYPEKPLKIVL